MDDRLDTGPPMTRRRFGAIAGGALASTALGGACRGSWARDADAGRLTARPRAGVTTSARGARTLGLDDARDAVLQVPATAIKGPLPLLVLFQRSAMLRKALALRRSAQD